MDPFGFGKIIAERWGIVMMYPTLFSVVLGFGFVLGVGITRIFLNERLTHQQMRISDLQGVLDNKLPAHFLPPPKRGKLMSFGFALVVFGLLSTAIGSIIVFRTISDNSPSPPPSNPGPSHGNLSTPAFQSEIKRRVETIDSLHKILDTSAQEELIAARSIAMPWERRPIPVLGIRAPTMADMKESEEKLDALITKSNDVIQQIDDVMKPYPQNLDEDLRSLMGDYKPPAILILATKMKERIRSLPDTADLQIMRLVMGEFTQPFTEASAGFDNWISQTKARLVAQRKEELGRLQVP